MSEKSQVAKSVVELRFFNVSWLWNCRETTKNGRFDKKAVLYYNVTVLRKDARPLGINDFIYLLSNYKIDFLRETKKKKGKKENEKETNSKG